MAMNRLQAEGVYKVGERDVPFKQVKIQERFRMYVPESFAEEENLSYRYTFFSNRGKSPLSVAVRFAPVSSREAQDKMIGNYFGEDQPVVLENGGFVRRIYYREAISPGMYMSIFMLRFAVEIDEGVLLGCFNCSALYREDWRDAVLAMLGGIERAETGDA